MYYMNFHLLFLPHILNCSPYSGLLHIVGVALHVVKAAAGLPKVEFSINHWIYFGNME